MKRFRLTPPKIRLSENDVEKACLDLLGYHHYRAVRLQSGLFPAPENLCPECRAKARWIRVGEPGLPDYVIPHFFMEVKRPGAKASPQQEVKIFELAKCWDLETALVDSVEALDQWLKQHPKP